MNVWPPQPGIAGIQALLQGAEHSHKSKSPQVTDLWLYTLRQIRELRMKLVKLSPTGLYSSLDYIKARAFVVLSHGAVEDYLEKICLEVVDAAIAAFNVDDRPRTALLALLRYGDGSAPPTSWSGGAWGIRQSLKSCRNELRRWADGNNGIKEKDVLRLLLPTGVKESDMGLPWLQAMSDLGELRGRVAHHGHLPGAAVPVDPKDALAAVEAVLPELSRIDARLVALRNE